MIASFVKRPVTTAMFVLLFVLLGMVSFFEINVERQPKIELPMVMVNVTYPGASPEEIESQVVRRIEDAVVEVSELKKIEARTFENFGYVLLEFKLSADVNIKAIEIKDKVEGILHLLPTEMDKPIVQKLDPFATPVVDIVLSSDQHNTTELYEYADKRLKNIFARITGVGEVKIFGGQERQIRVEMLPDLMRQRFIGVDEVINQLRARNLSLPAGNINQGQQSLSVRFEGEFKDLEEIKNFRLTSRDGRQFPLSDVASIYDGSKEITSLARYQGQSVLTLGIKKISDGNEVNVSRAIREALPGIQKSLPQGMQLVIANDQSSYVVRETNLTLESIVVGIIMTVAILMFFTGDWRTTIIASVVIPSSIVSAMLLVEKSGFSINFITLLALATSLGTLIANSIIIIESVMSQLEQGKDRISAAVEGTKRSFVPVIAACGTNLVVFTPIAFMGGIIGQFMMQFGMTVVYTTIFSLLASFSLTPMMCALMLSSESFTKKANWLSRLSNGFVQLLLREYKILFEMLFKVPLLSLAVMIAVFLGAFSVIPYVGNEFIPISDEDLITIQLSLPQGTKVERTGSVVEEMEKYLRNLEEVDTVLSVIGENGEENAKILANLVPAASRLRSDADLIAALTEDFSKFPDVDIEMIRGKGGEGQGGDISINIHGNDYTTMVELSEKVMALLQDSGYFRSVTTSHKNPKSELKFLPDQQKLERYGVASNQLAGIIRTAVYGDDNLKFREQGEEYPIVIELDERFKNSSESLEGIFVVAPMGLVALKDLGEFRLDNAVPNLMRRDRQRIIQLNGYLAKSTAGVVQAELDPLIKQLEFPEGYGYAFVGGAEMQEESGREIGKAFLLAVILTYMLLAAIMNSFLHPFTISTSIFTSYAGVFLGLFFLDSSINIASMLGIVMMVGLAVNNAILVLEEVEAILLQDPKMAIVDGLWLGITRRFRAVLMTSIAVVFGVLPQVWSPDLPKASMGIVVAGGMLASIFFAFFLTPLVYWYFERIKRWVLRHEKKKDLPQSDAVVSEHAVPSPGK